MKFKKYASKKVVSIVLSGLILSGVFFQNYKNYKIENNLSVQTTSQVTNHNISLMKETIQEELNNLCEYTIKTGSVNLKYKHNYSRKLLLGLESEATITGSADYYYEFNVNLSSAEVILANDNKIKINISEPTLNEKACHRVTGTFIRFDDECDFSLLNTKNDIENATREWEDSFSVYGLASIKDYYNDYYVKTQLMEDCKVSITKLLRELGYNQTIEVEIKKLKTNM